MLPLILLTIFLLQNVKILFGSDHLVPIFGSISGSISGVAGILGPIIGIFSEYFFRFPIVL